jgi:hypothetical protein
MQMRNTCLSLKFNLQEPLFDKAQLDTIQYLVEKHLPNWSRVIEVREDEDTPDVEIISDGQSLYEVANTIAPMRGSFSGVVLKGTYEGVLLIIFTSNSPPPSPLNYFKVQIIDLTEIEKQLTWQWAIEFFEDAILHLPVYYAQGYLKEEFYAKNMIIDNGRCAVGVNLLHSLPGVYWLNYFGSPYLELLQKSKLLSSPAYFTKEYDNGVILALDETPFSWQSESYQKREEDVIEHIGSCYFFSKSDPQRKTVAPEFRI